MERLVEVRLMVESVATSVIVSVTSSVNATVTLVTNRRAFSFVVGKGRTLERSVVTPLPAALMTPGWPPLTPSCEDASGSSCSSVSAVVWEVFEFQSFGSPQ